MKKIIVSVVALTLVLAMASCGEQEAPATSSEAPVSSEAAIISSNTSVDSVVIPSIVSQPEVESKNLAFKGTGIDMNTGKESTDEDFVAYYNDANGIACINDGDTAAANGWQMKSNETNLGVAKTDKPDQFPDGYYLDGETETAIDTATKYIGGDGNAYVKEVYAAGERWVGIKLDETAKVDTITLYLEKGSIFDTYENGGYIVETSADGEAWTPITATVERTITDGSDSVTDVVSFEATDILAVRIVVLKGTTKYCPKVNEIEIFAVEEAESEVTTE